MSFKKGLSQNAFDIVEPQFMPYTLLELTMVEVLCERNQIQFKNKSILYRE